MNKLRSFIAIKLVIKLFICAIISEYLISSYKGEKYEEGETVQYRSSKNT